MNRHRKTTISQLQIMKIMNIEKARLRHPVRLTSPCESDLPANMLKLFKLCNMLPLFAINRIIGKALLKV